MGFFGGLVTLGMLMGSVKELLGGWGEAQFFLCPLIHSLLGSDRASIKINGLCPTV